MAIRRGSSKKRIIKKTTGGTRPAMKSSKLKSELAGSFQMHARRNKVTQDKTIGREKMLCTGCGAVYFDKHWHSPSFAAGFDRDELLGALCEECKLGAKSDGSKVTGFEGEIVLEGLSDPAVRSEVLGLARNVGKRAQKRDPEDRIIKIVEADGNVVIYTTENQLAVSIGKQIDSARKGGKLDITWSRQDKPVRVHWTSPSEK